MSRQRGFTLMEMLVALGIFAVIGVLSSQLLRQTIDVSEVLMDRGDRLVEVQRAMNVMSRDFQQIVTRTVRDEFGDTSGHVVLDQFGVLKFTRMGWSNLLNRPRSTLQRVEYLLTDGVLTRRYWPVLDRTESTEPIDQELLTEIEELEFELIDVNNLEHISWPPLLDNIDGSEPVPVAIQLTMNVEPFGEVSRLWLLLQFPEIVESIERDGLPGGGPGGGLPIFGTSAQWERRL